MKDPIYQLLHRKHHDHPAQPGNVRIQPRTEAPMASVLSTAIHDAEQGAAWLTEHAGNLKAIENTTLANPVVQTVLESVVGVVDPAAEPVLVAIIKAFAAVPSNQKQAPAPVTEPEPPAL